ncbi:protein kinase-like domain, concanavalin A-like lectin/glucanase domain protein [Tanacetum coccineum]
MLNRFSSLLSQSGRFSLVASAPKPDKNEQVANPVLKRSWAMLLGISPALRAVASMSRQDWAKKLVHRKTKFVDTLKLLGVDVKIGSRLLVQLVCGKRLSRRDRQQLTKLLGIILNKAKDGGNSHSRSRVVEDITLVFDPRVSQVVLRKPFVELSNMTYDSSLGVVKLTKGDEEIAYKMPHKIEQYESLSNEEKENMKSVYL